MTDSNNHIARLLFKELQGTVTPEEAAALASWKAGHPDYEAFVEGLTDEETLAALLQEKHPEHLRVSKDRMWKRIEQEISFKVVPIHRRPLFRTASARWRIAVAACIAAFILIGGYLLLAPRPTKQTVATARDIPAPSTDKAVITLASGKQILVDTLTSYSDGNMTITRTDDGRLVYANLGSEVKFQTLSNPRGSKVIDMILSDGSHIWLNAGSSITYPTAFTSNERKVTMTGEAYFEIAASPQPLSEGEGLTKRPFIVSKGNMSVTVLGTHFNVNAYDDEDNIKVTLLEGSVRVNKDQQSLTIKPNQQAVVAASNLILNTNVNVEEVMAWKNGSFVFASADIKTIMREIARWYDVDVTYSGSITEKFRVDINRNTNVSNVFKILEETGKVHFKIEGKTVTVSP